MGPVVTINSATLINKGLELIEAHLLFGVPYERSTWWCTRSRSCTRWSPSSTARTLAQASPPDMKLPIALALGWPDRLAGAARPCRWDTAQSWTFEPLDDDAFPGVRLARAAGTAGGCLPAVLNAANEEAVAAFVAGRAAVHRHHRPAGAGARRGRRLDRGSRYRGGRARRRGVGAGRARG